MLTFPDNRVISLPLYPINVNRTGFIGPPPNNGTNPQQPPPINGGGAPQNGPRPPPPPQFQPGQPSFTYINNGTHVIIAMPNGKNDYYKINMAVQRAASLDFNTLLNLILMGQFNQQFDSLISNSNLDDATKLKLTQLGELFLKDPVNFWTNNWLDVAIFVSKLPKDFLAQFQNLILPIAN